MKIIYFGAVLLSVFGIVSCFGVLLSQNRPFQLEPICLHANPLPFECVSDPYPNTLVNREQQVKRLKEIIELQGKIIERQNAILDIDNKALAVCDRAFKEMEKLGKQK